MKICPHCGQHGLPWPTFLRSSRGAPCLCRQCRGVAHPNDALSLLVSAFSVPALAGMALLAWRWQSWWPLTGFLAVVFLLVPAFTFLMPAIGTTAAKARRSRRAMALGLVVLVLSVLVAGFFGGRY